MNMGRTFIGIAIASVVLYVWGFLYWGLGPWPTMIWHQAADDVAAGQALLEHFPEDGTWYVPGFSHEQETLEGLFSNGPVAFVHMLSSSGRPMMDPSIMIQGFFLNLAFIIVVALLLRHIGHALPAYGDRVKLIALTGLAATVLIDFGGAVWWQIDWPWKLCQAFYDFSAWLVVGLILAHFVPGTVNNASGTPADSADA